MRLLRESWYVYTLTDSERVYQRLYCRPRGLLNTVFVLSAAEYITTNKDIGRVSYLIYVSMRHHVLTTSGDIIVCFHTAVCLSC